MDFWGIWLVVGLSLTAGYGFGRLHQSVRMTEEFYQLRDEDDDQ